MFQNVDKNGNSLFAHAAQRHCRLFGKILVFEHRLQLRQRFIRLHFTQQRDDFDLAHLRRVGSIQQFQQSIRMTPLGGKQDEIILLSFSRNLVIA